MHTQKQHHHEKKQLNIILMMVFMSFLGASIAYPILPPLFLHPTSHALISTSWNETTRLLLLGLTLACFPFGQFIGSPILGRNSDKYGRKKMLLISLIGCIIGYTLIIIAFQTDCLWLLLIGQFVTGFMEGTYTIVKAFAAEFKTINKYMSFGRINSIGSLGYIAGPLLGGFLSDSQICAWFSYVIPFIFALFAMVIILILVYWKLPLHTAFNCIKKESLWQQLNIIKQFKALFSHYPHLKHLLIVSTLFTLSIDIFYEFSPVYLTGKWGMTSAMIAIYNVALSMALSLGSVWIPSSLSKHFSHHKIITFAMLATALILSCMIIFQHPLPMLLFFALMGFSITTVITTMSIHLSNMAHPDIQGEALGIQQSLRTLGDAIICLFGGLIAIISILFPIVLSCLIAFLATLLSLFYLDKK